MTYDKPPKPKIKQSPEEVEQKETFFEYLEALHLKKSVLYFWEYLRKKDPQSFKILDVGAGRDANFIKYLLLNKVHIENDYDLADYEEPVFSKFTEGNVLAVENGESFKDSIEPWKIQADMASMPIKDESCNIVVANGVLAFYVDQNEKGYPYHTSSAGEVYNFEEIIKELLRVTANPGVCMFDLPSYEQCEENIAFQKRDPEFVEKVKKFSNHVSIEELEKRKEFLMSAYAFLQNMRHDRYAVNFIPVTQRPQFGPVLTHFAVHITKNPDEYAKVQREFIQEDGGSMNVRSQLYLLEYPERAGFTYDYHYQLFPGAKTIKED